MRPESGRGEPYLKLILIIGIFFSWMFFSAQGFQTYFILDDTFFIERTTDLSFIEAMKDPRFPFFRPSTLEPDYYSVLTVSGSSNLFRPLTQDLYYRLMNFFFGFRPGPFHAFNALVQGLNILLVILLGHSVLNNTKAALWAGFFYAAAPFTVNLSNFISNITDLLMVFFALLSALCFVKADNNRGMSGRPAEDAGKKRWLNHRFWRIGGPVFFALSLVSKEVSIWLPAWFWVYAFLQTRESRNSYLSIIKKRWKIHLPFDLTALAYLSVRSIMLPPPTNGLYAISLIGWHWFDRLEEYLYDLTLTLGAPGLDRGHTYHLFTIAAVMIAAVSIFWIIKSKRKVHFEVGAGLCWCGIGISIYLPFLNKSDSYHLALPCVGFLWTAGYLITLALDQLRTTSARIILAVALAVFCFNCMRNHHLGMQHREFIAATELQTLHQQIKASHPTFPPNARIVLVTGGEKKLSPTRSGIKALYKRKDIEIVNAESFLTLHSDPRGMVLRPKPDVNFSNTFIFAFTPVGLKEFRVRGQDLVEINLNSMGPASPKAF